mmetsp:Transcript_31503/g.60056  ORF Transcript_31503/g.60056 Transcript_31503/m.60056 type:complete len:193 (-) Transcript_31503:1622-2200(-)
MPFRCVVPFAFDEGEGIRKSSEEDIRTCASLVPLFAERDVFSTRCIPWCAPEWRDGRTQISFRTLARIPLPYYAFVDKMDVTRHVLYVGSERNWFHSRDSSTTGVSSCRLSLNMFLGRTEWNIVALLVFFKVTEKETRGVNLQQGKHTPATKHDSTDLKIVVWMDGYSWKDDQSIIFVLLLHPPGRTVLNFF